MHDGFSVYSFTKYKCHTRTLSVSLPLVSAVCFPQLKSSIVKSRKTGSMTSHKHLLEDRWRDVCGLQALEQPPHCGFSSVPLRPHHQSREHLTLNREGVVGTAPVQTRRGQAQVQQHRLPLRTQTSGQLVQMQHGWNSRKDVVRYTTLN